MPMSSVDISLPEVGRCLRVENAADVVTALTQAMRDRQQSYLDRSRPVPLAEIRATPMLRKLWNNTLAIAGPVL